MAIMLIIFIGIDGVRFWFICSLVTGILLSINHRGMPCWFQRVLPNDWCG